MSDCNVCDNCKREPTKFKTDQNETAYWLRVPKENQDPSVLTSALDFAFIALVPENDDRRHPDDDPDNFYWCADCAASAYPESDLLNPPQHLKGKVMKKRKKHRHRYSIICGLCYLDVGSECTCKCECGKRKP